MESDLHQMNSRSFTFIDWFAESTARKDSERRNSFTDHVRDLVVHWKELVPPSGSLFVPGKRKSLFSSGPNIQNFMGRCPKAFIHNTSIDVRREKRQQVFNDSD